MTRWVRRGLSAVHLCGAILYMTMGLVPVTNACTVLYARGWTAWRSGLRVAHVKPPQFTDGQPVPHDAAVKAIFTAGGVLVLYAVVPVLLLPATAREPQRDR